MGLIVCSDCKREVSPSAAWCPSCGRPINPPKQREGFGHQLLKAGCLVIGLIFLSFIAFCGWASVPDSGPGSSNAVQRNVRPANGSARLSDGNGAVNRNASRQDAGSK